MNQDIETTKKNFFTSLDRATTIHLFMIATVIFAYILFLISQQYLFADEDLKPKLIIINILLVVGIVMEIGSFIWIMYNKKRKLEKKSRNTDAEDTIKQKD
ncbi:MAG: hypothetical protein KGD64_03555 [Candidatus Heimdallarchaeota archaeon]|nr:hypothetical protein [Candidatus Heimdallarchaeota archaeon]